MILGSTMLEVAIGMIFVYLLMSLLCSALGELISSLFRLRAKDLERGIQRLLDDTPAPDNRLLRWLRRGPPPASQSAEEVPRKLSESFFNHPLIRPLYEGRKPSYIPARTFSLALWNMATEAAKRAQGVAASPPVIASPPTLGGVVRHVEKDLTLLRNTIESLPPAVLPGELKRSLLIHMDEAGENFDKARRNVEKWYDDAMDRVSGAFRRRTQYILLGLGFTLALAMNVDSFNIFRALWGNEDLRKTVVAAADKYANQPLTTPTATPTPGAENAVTPAAGTAEAARAGTTGTDGTGDTASAGAAGAETTGTTGAETTGTAGAAVAGGAGTPTPTPTPTADQQFEEARARIKKIKGEINELGLPIGWDCAMPGRGAVGGANANANGNANANTNANANKNTNTNAATSAGAGVAAEDDWLRVKCETLSSSNLRGVPASPLGWLFKLAGLFLTALAVSQGAPFWFDLLNKFMVIRSTVKPQEKSRPQPSKDKPAPDTEEETENVG